MYEKIIIFLKGINAVISYEKRFELHMLDIYKKFAFIYVKHSSTELISKSNNNEINFPYKLSFWKNSTVCMSVFAVGIFLQHRQYLLYFYFKTRVENIGLKKNATDI